MTDISVDIPALAVLARLEVSEEELTTLKKEIPEILDFVETIKKASASGELHVPALRNVLRADEDPIESGKYTEMVLNAAPARDGNRVAVKQVVSRKQK